MRKPIAFIVVALAMLALAAGAAAQPPGSTATVSRAAVAPPRIVFVQAPPTTAVDGRVLYQAYCSSCHGTIGRGDGPAARAIRTPVPDLTHYGEMHPDCEASLIATLQTGHRGDGERPISESDLDMPNWAPIFQSMASNRGVAYLRMRNVAGYIVTIQAK
jgi:mono/diheme cytochrome c family protein